MTKLRRALRHALLLLIGAIAAALHPLPAQASDTAMLAKLRELYPGTRFESVSRSPISEVYEVVMGTTVAYVAGDGRYFLFGHLIDMPNGMRDLTALRLSEINRIDVKALRLDDAIKTVNGTGSRTLFVFSDPQCPYCRSLEPELAKLSDITIYTFPVALLGSDSQQKVLAAWCADDRTSAWRDIMFSGETPAAPSCPHPLDRNAALAAQIGIGGTPTLIAADGRVKSGAALAGEIETWLTMVAPDGREPAQAMTGDSQE